MSFNLATGGGETNLLDHYQSSSNHNNSGNSSSRDNGNNNNTENNTGSSNSSSSSQSQNQRQAHKSRNPPKLGACTECHKSKNKCVFSKEAQDFFNQVLALHDANSSTSGNAGTNSNDDGDDDDDGNSTNNDGNNVVAILQVLDPSLRPRCERCARLNKECLPHISRQGKRRKNRKDKDAAQSASSSSSSSGKKNVDDGAGDGDEEKTSRVAASGSDGSSGNGFEGFDSNSSSNRDSNVLTGSFNSTVQNNNIGRDRSVSVEFNNLLAALRRKQSQNQSQQQQNTSVQNQNFSQHQQQQQQQLQQLQQLQQQQQQQRLQQLQQLQQQRHHDFQPPQAQDNPLPNNDDFSQRYQSMLPSYPHHASNATTTTTNNSNNSQEESIRILLNQINNGNRNNNNNSIMNGNYNGDIPNAGNGLGTGPIPSRAHSAGNIHRGSMGSDSGINHNSNSSIQMPHGGRIHSNTAVGKGLDHRSIAGNNDWMQGNSYGMGNNSIINNNENLGNLGLVRSALDMNRRQSSGRSSTDYNNSSYDDNNNNNNATTNNINNNNNNTDTLSNNKNAIMPGSVSNALLLLARRGSDVSSSLGVDVANGSGTPTISNYSNNLHGSDNIMSNYDNMSLVLKNYLSKVTNSRYNNSNGNITSNNIKDGNVNDNINSANDSGSKNNSSVGSLGRHGYIRTNSNGNAHISSRSNTANDALNADCGTSLGHLLPTKTHSSTADDDNHVEFDCNVLPYKKQKRPRLSAVDEEATCKRGASQNRSSSRGASALPSSDSCCAGDGNGQNDVGESCIKHESIEGESLSRSSSSVFVGPEDTIGNAITKACAKNAGKSLTSLKYHYGLQCQIREWISMALVRRSFALLGKASTLANRCGIHMDRILCGIPEEEDHENNQDSYKPERHKNIGRRMNYLLAELLEPRSQQKIPLLERHMLSPRLSSDVLAMVGCQSCPTFQEQEMRNRWIIIRETHCGKSSFYCSPAFEQNVLCWSHISQIYEDNLADINSLIFVRDDFRRLIACVAQQLSSHSVEGMPPRPVHAPKTTVRLLSRQLSQSNCGAKDVVRKARGNDVMTLEMDLLVILIPTMDKTTYYLELFHRSCDEDGDDYLIDAKNQSSRRASNNINAGDDSPFKKSGMGDVQKDDSNPPTFDDVVESEEWVGIDDVLASGDIDDLITALCD